MTNYRKQERFASSHLCLYMLLNKVCRDENCVQGQEYGPRPRPVNNLLIFFCRFAFICLAAIDTEIILDCGTCCEKLGWLQ